MLFILGPMSGLNSDVFLKDIVQCATSTSLVWETRRRVWVSLTATSLPLITLDTTAKILQTLKAALITLDTTCATRAKGGKEYNGGERLEFDVNFSCASVGCELFGRNHSFFALCSVHSILCVVFDMQCAISSVLSVVCKHGLLWALHPVCPVCHFQSGSWYLSCLQIMARRLQYFVFLKFYFCICFFFVWTEISSQTGVL